MILSKVSPTPSLSSLIKILLNQGETGFPESTFENLISEITRVKYAMETGFCDRDKPLIEYNCQTASGEDLVQIRINKKTRQVIEIAWFEKIAESHPDYGYGVRLIPVRRLQAEAI